MDLEFWSDDEDDDNPLDGLSFGLDGVRFECKGRLSFLAVSNLAHFAISGDTREAAQAAAVTETLRQALGQDEYERFNAHVQEHKTADAKVLKIIQAVNDAIQKRVEEIAERPTVPAAPSSNGRAAPDGHALRSVSLQRGDVTVIEPGSQARRTG